MKNIKEFRKASILIILLVTFFSLLYYYATYKKNFTEVLVSQLNNSTIGEVTKNTNIRQFFKVNSNNFNGMQFHVATYGRQNIGNLNIKLIDVETQKVIYDENKNMAELQDNSYYKIQFDKISNSKDKNYCLEFSSEDAEVNNAITFWINTDSETKNAELFINDTKVSGNIMSIVEFSRFNIFTSIAFIFAEILFATFIFYKVKKVDYNYETILDNLIKNRFVIVLASFIILVSFEIHGFSIGMWDQYIQDEPINKNEISLLLGRPRGIRSDEWAVQVPFMLAQAQNDKYYPFYNDNIYTSEPGQNMVLSAAPIFDITIISKLEFFGFLLFGAAKGLSWFWWFRLFLLLLTSFEILMYVTNNNKLLSLIGSFVIAFAPALQWWHGTSLVDNIALGQLFFISILNYFKYKENRKIKILFAIFTVISSTGLVLHIYPGFQVPIGHILITFLISFIIINYKKIKLGKEDFIIISLAILSSVSILLYLLIKSKTDIDILSNTVYPGKRFVAGGYLAPQYLFTDIATWLEPFKPISTFSNNSEFSRFITLLPAIILISPFVINIKDELRVIRISLYILLFINISWMLLLYPKLFTKITLLYNVPPERLIVLTGLVSVYLGFSIFSSLLKTKPFKTYQVVIFSFIICLIYASSIKSSPGVVEYLDKFYLPTIIYFVLLNAMFLLGNKKGFTVLIIPIILTGMCVNPVVKGLGSIYNKKVSAKIFELKNTDPEGIWASTDWVRANYVSTHGVKIINSTNFYPNFEKYEKIDPNKLYQDIYNRYAHVGINITNEDTVFELVGPDSFFINLNKLDLNKLEVKYILTLDDLESFNDDSIKFERIYGEGDNIKIYEIKQ